MPGATLPWRARSSPVERTNLSVLTASPSCSPRDVPAVTSPSQARGAPGRSSICVRLTTHSTPRVAGLYHLKVATGTLSASSVSSVNSPWQGRDLLLTARTSFVRSAPRTNCAALTDHNGGFVRTLGFLTDISMYFLGFILICDRNKILFSY